MKNPTRQKVQEAKYFLSMMKQSFENDDTFSYNLSAFLAAARSITWIMQKQYAHRNGFAKWYCQKQIKMSADLELKYLNEARVEAVKKEPVPTGATRQVTIKVDAFLKKNVLETEPAERAKPKPSVERGPKTIRRFFPEFKDEDVLAFCEKQLDKLAGLVRECEELFL